MSVYAEKTFDDKPCKSTLGRASREAEGPSGRHGQSTASKGFLSSKGNWNKLSERKCINCIFSLESLLYKRFCNINKNCINCIFFKI